MSGAFDRVMEERKRMVQRIIDNMQNGYIMPKPKWNREITSFHNPVTHVKYRGGNMMKLWMASIDNHYTDLRFLTYKQASDQKWQVKKGAKGIRLEKYIFDKMVEQENPDTHEMEWVKIKLRKPMVNTFVVFNASQIDGIPPLEELKPLEHNDVLDIADHLIRSSECTISEIYQDRAYYSPARDEIVLPERNQFKDQESFTTTLIHEMVHSTGHESRLNRNIHNIFGTPEYALEELRAELGSFFMGTDLGIEGSQEILDSHTHYLESWIKALENDPNELFRACSDAQKAVNRLEQNYEQEMQESRAIEKAVDEVMDVEQEMDFEMEM